jgi:hypothetical protein
VTRSACLLLGLVVAACASDPAPPPPPPSGPLFADAFDGPAAFPAGWDSANGDVSVVDAPDAPSGGKALRAQSLTTRPRDALALKTLKATAVGATSLTCSFAVKLAKYGGDSQLTVGRLDIAGGALLFDLKPDAWHFFGRFGAQEIADGGTGQLLGKWSVVKITLESSGNVVVSFDGDERIKRVDTNATPLDASRGALELGLAAPPAIADTEALYDDVVCTSR